MFNGDGVNLKETDAGSRNRRNRDCHGKWRR